MVYDGACGLCHAVVQFLLRHDRRGVFVFASLQSEPGSQAVGRTGGDAARLDTVYVVTNWGTAVERGFDRSDAALVIGRELGGIWHLAAFARGVPRSWRNVVYDAVATHRYRLFGKREACLALTEDERRRFVDQGRP